MYTLLRTGIIACERRRGQEEAHPDAEEADSHGTGRTSRNRWERFRRWERGNVEQSSGQKQRKTERPQDGTRRLWRTSVENAWRTNHGALREILADTTSGKSHRSVTEEQEGEKKQLTEAPNLPSRTPHFVIFFNFALSLSFAISFAVTNRIDSTSLTRRFEIFRVNFDYRPINIEIHFRCRNCITRLVAPLYIIWLRSFTVRGLYHAANLFVWIYSPTCLSRCDTSNRHKLERRRTVRDI